MITRGGSPPAAGTPIVIVAGTTFTQTANTQRAAPLDIVVDGDFIFDGEVVFS